VSRSADASVAPDPATFCVYLFVAASSISFANTFGVLFTVVFYDLVVVPVTNKIGRPISMTFR
jgi:hypothetical protein